MAAKSPVTASVRPVNPRLSTVERRAAQTAVVAGRQAQLKREAAERRQARAARQDPSAGA